MDEKNIWILLFVLLLIVCGSMTAFLARNAGGVDCKKKYDELKGKYIVLATKHKDMLQNVLDIKTKLAGNAQPSGSDVKIGIAQLQEIIEGQREKINQLQGGVEKLVDDFKKGDEKFFLKFESEDEALRNKIVELDIKIQELNKTQ